MSTGTGSLEAPGRAGGGESGVRGGQTPDGSAGIPGGRAAVCQRGGGPGLTASGPRVTRGLCRCPQVCAHCWPHVGHAGQGHTAGSRWASGGGRSRSTCRRASPAGVEAPTRALDGIRDASHPFFSLGPKKLASDSASELPSLLFSMI